MLPVAIGCQDWDGRHLPDGRPSSVEGVTMNAAAAPAEAEGEIDEKSAGSGLERDPVASDARSFGAFSAAGGWMFALMVARSVRKGERASAEAADPAESGACGKVSMTAFAKSAGCDSGRVSRYWRAWERAAADGLVPPADALAPGQETPLPDADRWSSYFSLYEATGDRNENLAAMAETVGTSFGKAVEIASNRPAMRAAILGDPQTAAAAREALLERPHDRAAVLAQAMSDPVARKEAAVEARRMERAEYVQRVLSEGKARTPSGQVIEVTADDAERHLAVVQDPDASAEAVTEAYDFVQDLIADAVQADPDAYIHEQRTRLSKVVNSTVKSIQALDPDDLLAFADDTLITSVSELQQQVNALAAVLLRSP